MSSVPLGPHRSQDGSPLGGLGMMTGSGGMPHGGSLSGHSLSRGSLHATRGSLMSTVSSLMGPPNKQSSTTLASLAGLLGEGATPHRQPSETEGRDYSHREKNSTHNSRDSLAYPAAREAPLWDALGAVDLREKRSHGGSRGSSMSGITFLSREAVPVDLPRVPSGTQDTDWEWEMRPSEMGRCTTGSVHSLQSSSSIPRQGDTPPSMSYPASGAPPEGKFSSLHDLHSRPYPPSSYFKPQTSHQRNPSANASTALVSHEGGGPHIPEKKRKHHTPHRVKIIDANQVFDTLNLGRRIDVIWPDERMRSRGGRNFWGNWVPLEGMEGTVIHTWKPHHPDPKLRSHVERTIYLVQIQDKFVPVAKNAVREVSTNQQDDS